MSKIYKFWFWFSLTIGVVFVAGGLWGIIFTYQSIAQEKIITPEDASIPNIPVRGPFALKAQADIIRKHTLNITGGKTFAEMPRQVPKLDVNGKPELSKEGKEIMVDNTARNIWITATALMTALHLAILAYAFFGFLVIIGFLWVMNCFVFRSFSNSKS